MNETLCVILLLLLVLESGSADYQRRYFFISGNNNVYNWTEAQSYCRENYSDLVTIENMEQMNHMMQMISNNNSNDDVWIGLGKNSSSNVTWKWSLENPLIYQNWSAGKPGSSGDCGSVSGGAWSDTDCSEVQSFVCYNQSSGLVFVDQAMNWTNAQNFCRVNHTDLTSVMNQTQNLQIQNLVADPQKSVWIGLFRDAWSWSDQSDSGFRNWAPEEPNSAADQTCVQISRLDDQLRWKNVKCCWPCNFICQEDPLVLVQKNLTWPDALVYCRQNYQDLVSVVSPEVQTWVEKESRRATTGQVWVGLHHSCAVGLWFWVNGLVPCYDNWAAGNATGEEDCFPTVRSGAVESGGNHQWISFPETNRLNFICSRSWST